MNKILIISYFFPPANFAGSYRIHSWAEHLYKYGYYPVIVTRKYDSAVSNFIDLSKPTTKGILHEKHEHYEVYYLPYKGNLKDKLLIRFGDNKLVFLRKILSFTELVLQNFFLSAVPYNNLYSFSKSLIKDNDFNMMISSGKPYILFKLCKILSTKYDIPWIADYRDPWSTHTWFLKRGILSTLDNYFEKRWVGTASAITSCSQLWTDDISSFVKRPGYVIYNGYENYDDDNIGLRNDTFTLIHNGTLYNWQEIELFAQAFKKFIDSGDPYEVKILFLGISIENKQAERIKKIFENYTEYIELTERLSKEEIVRMMKASSLLLLFGHKDLKGWYPIKIFDYLSVQKPILLCPSDNDVLQEMINATHSGYVLNDIGKIVNLLKELYVKWENGIPLRINSDKGNIVKYSRENQANNLAKVFDEIIEKNNLIDNDIKNFRSEAFQLLNNTGYNAIIPQYRKFTKKVSVICFHSISPFKNFSYPPLHPQQFEQIIHYLSKKFYFTSFEEIRQTKSSSRALCVLTFDDGYGDFIEYALPILVKYKAPAVQNIVVDSIETGKPFWTQRLNNITNFLHSKKTTFLYTYQDERFLYTKKNFNDFYMKLFSFLIENSSYVKNKILSEIEDILFDFNFYDIRMMSWNEIRQCCDNNITIGSHSLTHDTLSTIQNREILLDEIELSKKIISEKINKPVTTFAFPNGSYNDDVLEIAKKNYDYLLCTKEKPIKRSDFENLPIVVPRLSVNMHSYWENIAKINKFHSIFKFEKQ
jgi:peptidoglycan/xylan/chitin deacetylase (PgdA/CDA1 family)/glycosyltransferase involved in cell wall biosynthesis